MAAGPNLRAVGEALELVPDDDLVHVDGCEWSWLARTGTSRSTLPAGRIETILGPITTRPLGTLERMRRRYPD